MPTQTTWKKLAPDLFLFADACNVYHLDHSDALNQVRDHYNAAVWLHPWVAAPIRDRNRSDVPFLPTESVVPDRLLPETGTFRWSEYRFGIRSVPRPPGWATTTAAPPTGSPL
jgi:hypothetical protein